MELDQLRIFCAVVESRSFTKAGELVYLSQPTVSFQVNSLERELGVKLLDRRAREVTVTRSGEVFYRHARGILKRVHDAGQAMENLKGLVKGELTIGASNIPGEYILPSALAKFKAKYPGIDLDLIIDDTRGIITRVRENQIELGVVGREEKDNKLAFYSFAADRIVLVGTANFTPYDGKGIAPEKLEDLPFIFREPGSGTRATVRQGLENAGIREGNLNAVMVLGSTAAVKKAVESSAGVSFISGKAIENEVRWGTIKVIPVRGLEITREFFMVYKRHASLSPAAEALLRFLKEKKE